MAGSTTDTIPCPLCGKKLVDQFRIRQEMVPATVPEYFSRAKSAVYRRTVNYVTVKCVNDHEFKRIGDGIYGMQYDF